MTRIRGIFEPFAPYVNKQLNLRKKILSNSDDNGNILSNVRFKESPELFYAYAVEKQCTVRMMSGVDMRPEAYAKVLELNPNLPEDAHAIEDETYLIGRGGSKLARQYILEGGTRYYDDKTKWGWRGGFTTGNPVDDHKYAFSYGDKNVRANPDGDFGAVPMPGIIDAQIRTKSEHGALREAQVNFVCFNRRQLSVLEMLYMRPGFPVCLEWGWNPYVSNSKNRETLDYTVKTEFFKQDSSLDDINDQIIKYKKASGGNYDGFIGYVKNFNFKAREDGGYDCTTEIIAHGEILESLRSPGIKTHRISDETEDPLVEITDRMLFYLRALKHQFNSEGSQLSLQRLVTEKASADWNSDNADMEKVPSPPPEYTGQSLEQKELAIAQRQEANATIARDSERNKNPYTVKSEEELLEKAKKELETDAFNFLENNPELKKIILDKGEINIDALKKIQAKKDAIENVNLLAEYDNALPTDMIRDRSRLNYNVENFNAQVAAREKEADELNNKAKMWNEFIKVYAKELDINVPVEYNVAYGDIAKLFKFINKETTPVVTDKIEKFVTEGFESLLGGSILRQTIKYPEYVKWDYSETEKVVVKKRALWWDKTVDVPVANSVDYDSGRRRQVYIRWDLLSQMLNHLSNATADQVNDKLSLIYNKKIANGKKPKEGLTTNFLEINYMGPNERTWNNNPPSDGKTDDGKNRSYLSYMPCINMLSDPTTKKIPKEFQGQFHPIIGNSFDERICLMPHQAIFDDMFENDRFIHGTYFEEDPDTGLIEESSSDKNKDPVKLRTISSYKSEYKAKSMRNSIGFVYFNLDFLISSYETLRLKKVSTKDRDSGATGTMLTLDDRFSVFDFISTIWQGVNDACAGYYNFQLHTEHEQPHKVRIVDMRLFGKPDEKTYTFDPQGLKSITRQFYFDSKIDANMAAAISIAAQAPNSMQDLDSLSFKAFHKNIKSRFILGDFAEEESSDAKAVQKEYYDKLEEDIIDFNQSYNYLVFFLRRLNNSNYDTDLKVLQPHEAIQQAQRFIELRNNILHRYPLNKKDGTTHPKAGQWRKGTTLESNAIIPLQCNMQLDGIAGLIPLQLFKIEKNKLPIGYERPDIVFVVKSEVQKITSTQDWTTEITGQLALTDYNPNNDGTNNILEYTDPPAVLDQILHNPAFAATCPWADMLRDVVDELGHSESTYVNDEDKQEEYITRGLLLPNEKILTGEIASAVSSQSARETYSKGDITPDMCAFMIILLRCMYDEDYANQLIYGEDYFEKYGDVVYDNGGELANVKLNFNGGNDIEHLDGKYSGTKHIDGLAMDIGLTGNYRPKAIGDKNNPWKIKWSALHKKRSERWRELSTQYANLVAENYTWHNGSWFHGGKGANGGKLSSADIGPINPQGANLSQERIQEIATQFYNRKFKDAGSFAGVELDYPELVFENIVHYNRLIKLLVHLKKIFPNLWWIDEYRKIGKTGTGYHLHIYSPNGKPIVSLDQMSLSKNKLKLSGRETYIHSSGF
tara:strand:- start:1142 stop:5644 length:4503 start_codon:yes stop_codon:yes gene_type:complete